LPCNACAGEYINESGRRHLMVDDPPDNAVALQLPELLDQHLLGDGG
jgi:hypothetical protein